MTANVVEILVKSTDDSKAGFAGAKANAEGAAESADAYAEATDRAAQAEARFRQAQADVDEALARQDQLQQSGTATADELAAAQDRVTQATLRSLDAQKSLADADAEVAGAQAAQGAVAEETAAKTDTAGGLTAGAGAKMKMAAVGVAVGLGLAIKSGMDFQQESTKWVTSAGESASQLGMLQQGVLKLSAQTATSSSQLASGLYMISSAGITGAGGLSVLKAAAEGAKSEGADLAEVTNALTSGINAYGMKTKTSAEATVSATSIMNQMLATVSAGKMTFQELAGSLSTILPIAAANKISYAQVGGALATMTSMGMSARQGAQDLAHTIGSLGNVTSVQANEMAEFGISSTDVSARLGQRGLTGTIEYLSDAITKKMGPAGLVIVNSMNQSKAAAADASQMLGMLPESIRGIAKAYLDGTASYSTWYAATKTLPLQARTMADQFATVAGKAHGFNQLLSSGAPAAQTYAAAMAKMLGGATGLNVGLMLTGTHAATFDANVKSIAAHADGASGQVSGFADVTKETSFQMAKAESSIKAAGTELGLALLPAVNAILTPLSSMLSFIAGNKVAAEAFAVVVGGVLAGALGAKLAGALKDMKDGIKGAADGMQWLGGKLGILSGEQDAAAATAQADAGIQEAAAEESSGSIVTSLGKAIAATAGWIAEHAVATAMFVAQNVAQAASATAAWVAENAATLGIVALIALLVAAIVYLATHWRQVWGDVKKWALDAWHFLENDVFHPITRGAEELWRDVSGWVTRLFADFISTETRGIGDIVSWFARLPGRILGAISGLASSLYSAGLRMMESFGDGIASGFDSVRHNVAHYADDLFGWIPHSPAKWGPLSGDGAPEPSGRRIARQLAQGIMSGLPDIRAAMNMTGLTAGLAGRGVPAGGYGYGAGGKQDITLRILVSDSQIMTAIMRQTRVMGGDPDMFIRKVAFR